MKKIKAKPVKAPNLRRDVVFVEVHSRLAYYLLSQELYDKHCFKQMGRCILANLRGEPLEDNDYEFY